MKIFCDSSTKEACYVIEGQKTVIIPYPRPVTVNVGEYKAVQFALWDAMNRKRIKPIEVYTDSLLVVNQVNGSYKCRKPHLLPLLTKTKELLEEAQAILMWIPREENIAGRVLGNR